MGETLNARQQIQIIPDSELRVTCELEADAETGMIGTSGTR